MEKKNFPMSVWCQERNNVLVLALYIQPAAKCNQIAGVVGKELKVRIAAPSIEDKANTELVLYLATLFKIPKSQIKIRRGLKSRHKVIEVTGCSINLIQGIVGLA